MKRVGQAGRRAGRNGGFTLKRWAGIIAVVILCIFVSIAAIGCNDETQKPQDPNPTVTDNEPETPKEPSTPETPTNPTNPSNPEEQQPTLSSETDILNFSSGTIEGNELYIFITHDTENVNLTDKITVSEGATWELFNNDTKVDNKTLSNLANRDNQFTITVTAENGSTTKNYTLTAYKSYEVKVKYFDGDTELSEETAYTGVEFIPDYEPDLPGSVFNFWKDENGSRVNTITPWDNISLYADKTLLSSEADILTFSSGTIEENELYIFIPHDTESVNLTDKITVSNGATWELFKSDTKVENKTLSNLANRDNQFTITVTAEDEITTKNYILIAYKSYEVKVKYFDGDTELAEETAYTGVEFVPDYEPDLPGSVFNFWKDENGSRVNTIIPWDNVSLYADKTLLSSEADILNFSSGTIEGNELYIFVPHDTESVNLTDKITVSEGATWELFKSDTKVDNKTLSNLANRDNQFTITVTAEDEITTKNYTLTANKSYEITVSFYNGTSLLKTQNAYTGVEFIPDYEPAIEHFKFNFWKDESENKIDAITPWDNVSLYADLTSVKYTVTTTQNTGGTISADGNEYEFGNTCTLTVDINDGYIFLGFFEEDRLLAAAQSYDLTVERTTTIEGRFAPIEITLNSGSEGKIEGSVPTKGIAGDEFTVTAEAVFLGYEAEGWYLNGEPVNTGAEITITLAQGEKNYEARFCPTEEMRKFGFTATAEECNITKVKDTALETITVPDLVTEIAEGAFAGCGALTELTLPFVGKNRETTEPREKLLGFLFGAEEFEGGKIISQQYGAGGRKKYDFCLPTLLERVTVNGGTLGAGAFSGTQIKEVILVGITEISDYTFCDCAELTSVSGLESATKIGNRAFQSCFSLTEIRFGAGLSYIGAMAFDGCGLKSARFAEPSGWSSGGSAIDKETLSDSASAALELTENCSAEWTRG